MEDMRQTERLGNAEIKPEHFDDFESMDVVLRGLTRVLADKPKPDTMSGQNETEETEEVEETGYEDDDWGDESWDDYGYGDERAEELEREKQFEVFTIPTELLKEYQIPEDLPRGVSIMGGTARSLARKLVSGDSEPVRDLDLVYIPELADTENPPTEAELDTLSAKYMPDDYAYGHGIGSENLENYFGTRDFTVNQCLIAGDKLLMTRAAYDDLQENIVRLSYHEQPYKLSEIGDRMIMKAIMMQTVLEDCTRSYPALEDFNYDFDQIQIRDFTLALTLNKMMGRGVKAAMHLTENLVDYDIVDEKFIDQPMALATAILKNGYTNFKFRPMDAKNNDDEELFQDIDKYQASDYNIVKALREYEKPSTKMQTWMEPMGGEYTQEDYDRINSAVVQVA